MYHKGVTRDSVIHTAVEIVERDGLAGFSMHVLAGELGIRTASLYKHVAGLDDVITEIGSYALRLLKSDIETAIGDLHGDEAVMALAVAYREYAQNHSELYKTILNMQKMDNETLSKDASILAELVVDVLDDYDLTQKEKSHWQRILRSFMHGFITHEEAGYFIHYDADKEDTYLIGIQCFLDGMRHRKEKSDRML